MKSTFFVMLWAFIFALVCAGVCPPVAADIWTSGKVVYTSNTYGDKDIVVMGPNGGHPEEMWVLAGSGDDEYDPTLSRNGDLLLYVRRSNRQSRLSDPTGSDSIYVRGSNGEHHLVVPNAGAPTWAPTTLYGSDYGINLNVFTDGERQAQYVSKYAAGWIPIFQNVNYPDRVKNKWLYAFAYISNRGNRVLRVGALYWDNGGWSRILLLTIDGENQPSDPAWSPDGRYIAYVAGGTWEEALKGASLYVYDIVKETRTKIVQGISGRYMSKPTWGRGEILFAWSNPGFRGGALGLFSVSPDGSGLRITYS